MDYCRKQLKSDCEQLLSRFQQSDSVRFEVFSEIWREMKFSHIFYGTLSSERRAFSQQVLDSACSFFLPPFTFQIRVGGLYLLYSLFHSQTAEPREPIRLALKDWEEVKKFEVDAAEAQHLDAVYILRQLLHRKAFYFTAMPGPLFFRVKRKTERLPLCESFMERASRPQELFSVDLLEELSNVHEHYERLKTSISSSAGEPDPSVNLIRRDLLPQLRNTVLDFHKWQKQKTAPCEADADGGEGTSAQQESSRRAELLASIKSKSYGQAVEASKARRHRQVEVESAGHDSGPSGSASLGDNRKLSLKARTDENMQLRGEMWKETVSSTSLCHLTTLDSVPEDAPRKFMKFKW
uniref:snRNA-activating protein complex subunit 1-like n=1 Tax=Centroberyx gerrardi TaxID=166262 RepID=UPI003AAFEB55